MKIRHLLSAATFATGTLGLTAMVADQVWSTRELLYKRAQIRGEAIAESMSVLSVPYLKGESTIKRRSLQLFSRLPGVDYAVVRDRKGAPIFEYAPRLQRLRTAESSERLPVFHEIADGNDVLGTVRLTLSLQNINSQLQTILWRGVAMGILALGALAIIAWGLGALLGLQLDRFVVAMERRDPSLLGHLPRILSGSVMEKAWIVFDKLQADLKKEEAQRQHAEKLKDDLIGMIVHDLKHPVTILHTVLAIIQDKHADASPKDTLQPMNMAARAVTRLNAMIDDVLQIARMNNTEMPLERQRFELGTFLDEVVRESRLIVEHTGRVFRQEITPEAGHRWTFGDKRLLRRLVGNLVLNAVDHAPDGAKVTMGARPSPREASSVEIFIHNEGSAIPKSQLGSIFEKYVSLGESVRNVGLGLAFCQLVATRHRGRLTAASEEGTGTAFTLTLPTTTQTPTAPADPSAENQQGQDKPESTT